MFLRFFLHLSVLFLVRCPACPLGEKKKHSPCMFTRLLLAGRSADDPGFFAVRKSSWAMGGDGSSRYIPLLTAYLSISNIGCVFIDFPLCYLLFFFSMSILSVAVFPTVCLPVCSALFGFSIIHFLGTFTIISVISTLPVISYVLYLSLLDPSIRFRWRPCY